MRRHGFRLAWYCALLVLLASASIALAQGSGDAPVDLGEQKTKLWGDDRMQAVYRAAETLESGVIENVPSPDEAGAQDLWEWRKLTRVAYQSVRDGNWEIYTSNYYGSEVQRETGKGEADIAPSLNRGATHIAYASARYGNYDIFKTAVGSLSPVRLTSAAGDETYPRWSRDGKKIVYSRVDGSNQDVWIMAADGSSQKQLTTDPGIDTRPVWSPDDATIAWVWGNSTGNAIMLMDADGGNRRALIRNLPYLGSLAWSPDGTEIGFDYDFDGDGWNELATVSPSGGRPELMHDPGASLVDVWMGAWVNEDVMFTQVTYKTQGGELQIKRLDIARRAARWGSTYTLSGSGVEMLPDWQYSDGQAPICQFGALPAEAPHTFTVQWTGSDVGKAGMGSFDLQVRDGAAGAWQEWLTRTTATSATYDGMAGHTYWFRVRGRDELGNTGEWETAPQVSATVEQRPPVTKVNALPSQSQFRIGVRWSGNDIGGSGVCKYDVQVLNLSTSAWSNWVTGTTQEWGIYTGQAGQQFGFRSRGYDCAGNVEAYPDAPDATTMVETDPPIAHIVPLPSFSRTFFWVHWEGTDPGGSGIVNWQSEYRDLTHGTDWRELMRWAPLPDFSLTGIGGHRVEVRVRAQDGAGNIGPWSEDGESQMTTLYAWRLTGSIRDNIGRPISGAEILIDPAPFTGATSDKEGAIAAYLPSAGDAISVGIRADGYGILPVSSYRKTVDGEIAAIMPPNGDRIRDGGFEASDTSQAWIASGDYPVALTDTLHVTGGHSLALGSLGRASSEDRSALFEAGRGDSSSLAPEPDLVSHEGAANESGEARIEQGQVLVPPASFDPVVSFSYVLEGASSTGAGLAVLVADGSRSTTVYSTTENTIGWTHAWTDLSEFGGQTISLSFVVKEVAGKPLARAYIDDVSVGASAHPDLWVSAGSQLGQPGETITMSAAYGNRGDAPAGSTITLTLPAGVTFVSADPAPAATAPEITWTTGDLDAGSEIQTIAVVVRIDDDAPFGALLGDAQIATLADEVDRADNASISAVYVGGRRAWLPLWRSDLSAD